MNEQKHFAGLACHLEGFMVNGQSSMVNGVLNFESPALFAIPQFASY
jgi:hypothetical protein